MPSLPCPRRALFFLSCWLLGATRAPTALATVTPYLEQSWFFDWSTAGAPAPTVAQCDTLTITWSRGSATGPNPVAPYYLQVYTSAFIVPFVIPAGSGQSLDWPVPFIPGTQFQLCMFDMNGNTGGCQRQMTVYPANVSEPTCANLTYPTSAMHVEAEDDTGPLSQYGWPDQCTDISLTPKNGTPPYTMTVAPALHPPYNITVDAVKPINWTISLNWGQAFYISLVDSANNTWANGPLHAGGNGPTSCLALGGSKNHDETSIYAAIGAGVGGLVVGLLIGLLTLCLPGVFLCKICRRRRPVGMTVDAGSNSSSRAASPIDYTHAQRADQYSAVNTMPEFGMRPAVHAHERTHRRGQSSVTSSTALSPSQGYLGRESTYKIEPWLPPGADRESTLSSPQSASRPTSASRTTSTPAPRMHASSPSFVSAPPGSVADTSEPPADEPARSHVYVVHHDGGRPPVSVYTADGTEVVELPPRYADGTPVSAHARAQPAPDALRESPISPQRRSPNAPRKVEMRLENRTDSL